MALKKLCEYYWASFKSDCEELLGCFQQIESVQCEEFSAICREMDFSSVFLLQRQVEMVTSGSGADQALFSHKRRPPSLRTRTWENFGKPGEPEPTKEWLLSVMEEDKTALKRKDQRRFKW